MVDGFLFDKLAKIAEAIIARQSPTASEAMPCVAAMNSIERRAVGKIPTARSGAPGRCC